MNRVVLVVGLLIVVPLLIFLAIGFRFDPRTIESPLVGKPAPEFSLVDLDGRPVALDDLLGRPVVINFWATWCQTCIVEHPILLQAARSYEGRAHFVGIVYQDEPEPIRRFVERRGAWGPSLLDPSSRVAIAYGVYGAPETFILDSEGRVVRKVTGMVDWDVLTETLDSLL
ncbi:MAG: redoxin domain-containing protein [Thermoanaerobaculia bacterium]|nr:redoxin domain-containing protein [Thermoanaerobaculia bacterium]